MLVILYSAPCDRKYITSKHNNALNQRKSFNPLMPGGNKKVPHT